MNAKINEINKQIGALMKAKKADETVPLKADKKALEDEKVEYEKVAVAAEAKLESRLNRIGNILHESAPVGIDEEGPNGNPVMDTFWPTGRTEESELARRKTMLVDAPEGKGVKGLLSHHEVLEKMKGYDHARGSKVAGHRGYFLTGPGVDLNLAIIRYGLDFLENQGYTKLWTPFFMRKVWRLGCLLL
jgi:seryl-tRNA synthetase